jgi:hypothetical protein
MDDAQCRRECIAGFRVTMRRASSSDNPMRIVTLNVFGEGPSRAFGRRVLCVPHESAGRGISLRAPQTTDHRPRLRTACPEKSRRVAASSAAPVHPEQRATQRAKRAAAKIVAPLTHTFAAPFAAPPRKRLEKCLSSHSPLATRHSPLPFSNRYCLRIEIPVTHTKQTTGNFLIDTQNATFCTKNTARSLSPASLLSPPLATRLPRAHLAKGHSPLVTPEWYNHPLHPPASNLAGPQAAAGKRKIA